MLQVFNLELDAVLEVLLACSGLNLVSRVNLSTVLGVVVGQVLQQFGLMSQVKRGQLCIGIGAGFLVFLSTPCVQRQDGFLGLLLYVVFLVDSVVVLL